KGGEIIQSSLASAPCQDPTMVHVIVLGSGTPNPDPHRAGAAVAVVGESSWLMVDCGRAATQRALCAGLDPTAVAAVLITHHHSDHLSDLATFATARWVAGATSPLKVVAPRGPAAAFARACLDAFADQVFHRQADASAGPRPTISALAFDASRDMATVLEIDEWAVSSVLVDHHRSNRPSDTSSNRAASASQSA